MSFPEQNFNTNPAEGAVEHVDIDMNAEVEAAKPEADFNERLAPPPAGIVPIKWSLAEKGVVPSLSKNKVPFLNVFLKGELLIPPPYENYPTNYYMNSLVGRSGTSEVHFFMHSVGEPLPARMTLGAMKDKLEEVLSNNPVGNAEVDWRASYQDGTDPRTNKPKWVEQAMHMNQFPFIDELDDDGNKTGRKVRSHILKSKKDGEPLYAQLYVVKHLTQADVKKLTKTA